MNLKKNFFKLLQKKKKVEISIYDDTNVYNSLAEGIKYSTKIKYENNNLFAIGEMELKTGKKNGEWLYFYRNNNSPYKVMLHNKINEITEKYYPSGELLFKKIKNKNFIFLEHYFKSGEIKKINIINSQDLNNKISYEYSFYLSGNIKEKKILKNQKKQGRYYFYEEDGILLIECNYNNNLLEGKYLEYYENGNLKIEINYINGKKTGFYKEYYENGELKIYSVFENDSLIAKLGEYQENGSLME